MVRISVVSPSCRERAWNRIFRFAPVVGWPMADELVRLVSGTAQRSGRHSRQPGRKRTSPWLLAVAKAQDTSGSIQYCLLRVSRVPLEIPPHVVSESKRRAVKALCHSSPSCCVTMTAADRNKTWPGLQRQSKICGQEPCRCPIASNRAGWDENGDGRGSGWRVGTGTGMRVLMGDERAGVVLARAKISARAIFKPGSI